VWLAGESSSTATATTSCDELESADSAALTLPFGRDSLVRVKVDRAKTATARAA